MLFRLMRGSGVAGLRGMAPMSRRDGITIARPLLGVGKSALVAFARRAAAAFVRGSVERGARFARPRLRALIAASPARGSTREGLARLARRAAEADEALERMTAEVETRLGGDGADRRPRPVRGADRDRPAHPRPSDRGRRRAGLEPDRAREDRGAGASPARCFDGGRALKANVGGAVARLDSQGQAELRAGAGTKTAIWRVGIRARRNGSFPMTSSA